MKDREKWNIPYENQTNNGDGTCIHSVACSRRSDSRARCSDGGERVKSHAEETRGKKRGESGESLPFFFFPRQFFDRTLLSERLEEAIHSVVRPVFRRSPLNSVHECDEG